MHSHHGFARSCSSVGSGGSTGTVQHHRLRSLSGSSLSSLASLWAPPFRRHDDSTPSRSSSSHNITLRKAPTCSDRRSSSGNVSRRTSFASVLSSRFRSEPVFGPEQNEQRLLDVAESDNEITEPDDHHASLIEEECLGNDLHIQPLPPTVVEDATTGITPDALNYSPKATWMRRWISTLRRRKQQQPPTVTPRTERWKLDDFESASISPARRCLSHHKQSDSWGSFPRIRHRRQISHGHHR